MIEAGLILEGGGMRGIYSAGVLDFLLDQNLMFKHVYGVSAGACHACSYLSRQKGRAMRTVINYAGDPRYASMRNFITTGNFFETKFVYEEIPNLLLPFDHETFMQRESELYAVLTNCNTGQATYLPVQDLRHDINIIRASSSLPLLSTMVEIDGNRYLDGGIADSIPIGHSLKEGNIRNLIVLTQHRGYQKDSSSMTPLLKLRYRRYPQLVQSIETRHHRYNNATKLAYEKEKEGTAFIIQPQAPLQIGRLEKDKGKLEAIYQQGYQEASCNAAALKNFFAD